MKKILTSVIFLGIIIYTANAQWVQQSSPTSQDLFNVKFFNKSAGVIVGNGIILTSQDTGKTWSPVNIPTWYLEGACYQSRDSIWAAGFTSDRDYIVRSTDGGLNWSPVDTSSADYVGYGAAVFFYHKINGWVAGSAGTSGWIKRSTNGGQTWQTVTTNLQAINDIFFVDSLTGWACSEYGEIYKSTDGGQTWNLNLTVPYTQPIRSIYFTTPDSGWMAGGIAGEQIIIKTTNGGIDWTISDVGGSSLHGLYFTDSRNGWSVGGANAGLRIIRTTDGGETWTLQPLPTLVPEPFYFESIYMINTTTGIVAADNGVILRTENGGLTGIDIKPFIKPNTFELMQNYPNPFNPSTIIKYSLPTESKVTIKIYNLLGQEIKTLVNKTETAGNHQVTFNAGNLSSGIYLYRIQAGDYIQTKKMVLLK